MFETLANCHFVNVYTARVTKTIAVFSALIIYFVCGGFQLSNPVGYRYLGLHTVKY